MGGNNNTSALLDSPYTPDHLQFTLSHTKERFPSMILPYNRTTMSGWLLKVYTFHKTT